MTIEVQEPQATLDTSLLNDVITTRRRLLIPVAALVFAVALVYQLFFLPQTFTSTVSIAIQQPSMGSGASALALFAPQAGSKKYIGIVRSRVIAENVERRVHLQQFYHLPSFQKTVKMLMGSIKVDERANEGLLFIDVVLPGPPLMAFNQGPRREAIKELTATTANAYLTALRSYYAKNDNERDSVLLREADVMIKKERANFEEAINSLRYFSRALPNDPRMMPTPAGATGGGNSASSGNNDNTPGANELVSLYQSLYKVESDLAAAQTAQMAAERMLSDQLKNLTSLPSEDPLLTDARDEYNRAATSLENLLLQYGPENARVVAAKERKRMAEERLARQVKGIRENLTTDQLGVKMRIESLQARRATLLGQIGAAENRMPTKRELATRLEQLRGELTIALERRKTTETKAAELRLSAVPGQTRLSAVDTALPPEIGSPGYLRITLMSLAAALGVVLAWILVEYIRLSRQQTASHAITLG